RIIRLFCFTKIELLYYADVPLETTRMYALFTHLKEEIHISIEYIPCEKDLETDYYRKEADIMRTNSIKSYLTCHYQGMDFRDLKHIYCDNLFLLEISHFINDLPLNAVLITKDKGNSSSFFNVMYVSEEAIQYGDKQVLLERLNIVSLSPDTSVDIFNHMMHGQFIHHSIPAHNLVRDFVPGIGVATLNLLYLFEDGIYCKYRGHLFRLGHLDDSLEHIILQVTLLSEYKKLAYASLAESALYYIAKLNHTPCKVNHILLSSQTRKTLIEQLWHILILSDDHHHHIIVDMKRQKIRRIKSQQFNYLKMLNQHQKKYPTCFSS